VTGDVVDRYPETKKCISELVKIKNLVYVLGNHDVWFLDWLYTPQRNTQDWDMNGGSETRKSYGDSGIPDSHRMLFRQIKYYHIEDNKLFVHAGWDEAKAAEEQERHVLTWDRSFWGKAKKKHAEKSGYTFTQYEEVFIGHTPTYTSGPLRQCNVWNIDQGAGFRGHLTIMDIDTHEWWPSDCVQDLYPGQ